MTKIILEFNVTRDYNKFTHDKGREMEQWNGSRRKAVACRCALVLALGNRAIGDDRDFYLVYWLGQLGGLMGEW